MFEFLSDGFIFNFLFPIGVAGLVLLFVAYFIPVSLIKFKIPALLLGIILLLFSVFYYGKKVEFVKAELQRQQDLVRIQQLEIASQQVTTQTVIKYVDKIKVIEKERLVYVDKIKNAFTPEIILDYPIPNLFVRVLDDAAQGKIPDSTGVADGTTSEIKINDAATYISENYTTCRLNSEKLESLQNWIKFQQKVFASE